MGRAQALETVVPELPEVETFRRHAMRVLAGKHLTTVNVVGDAIVFDGVKAPVISNAMTGRRVVGSGRIGKNMWLELDGGPAVLFHFGMSGSFVEYRSEDDRPAFWKIEMITETGDRLALRMPRRLGRVRLRDDPRKEPPLVGLGFDPYDAMLGKAAFREVFGGAKRPIKALLLDQKRLAGVGNWIADEVLYQAAIHPGTLAKDLDTAALDRLRSKLIFVLKRAVDVSADDAKFPKTWLFHHRLGKVYGAKTAAGDPIQFTEVGGRTTAFVPRVQGAAP